MKYAVVYISETSNTKELAENIFASLPENDKVIENAKTMNELPKADFYFVGFPVKNRTFGIEVMDILEQIEDEKVALFASCGLPVNDKYKQYIENAVSPWINDSSKYCGLFLCQGRISEEYRGKLENETNYSSDEIDKIVEMSSSHPDEKDIDRLYEFVDTVIG